MASISCEEIARQLLDCCLQGATWPRQHLQLLLENDCSDALFRIVVEGLADRFEPALCDVYADLFAEAVEYVLPGTDPAQLAARYRRVRRPRKFEGRDVEKVFVLSRVTLGADVAVTSVVLNAMKRRFPRAEIYLAGPRKNWEMFAADPRILHLPVTYRRGSLGERLSVWPELCKALSQPHSIVVDPDSRLTQLGLLPVCPDENYFFFESRGYGGESMDSLSILTSRWMRETCGVEAMPYVALPLSADIGPRPAVAVSLGVGENPDKRLPDPFEEELLRELLRCSGSVWIDKGAGGEEAARVERAAPASVSRWDSSFAGFASIIARSDLYFGYDSAGQHVAAACGIPLVSIFGGAASDRMFARWRPTGSGPIEVIRVTGADPRQGLAQTIAAWKRLYPAL